MKRVTMLDCIKRVSSIAERIVNDREVTFEKLVKLVKKRKGISAIYFVGSGTSNTSSVTASLFVEKATGVPTFAVLPNLFLSKTSYDPKALYVFVSQSGTSTLTQACLRKAKSFGGLTAALTGEEGTLLDSEADVWLNMNCGYEEYSYRTIGYCSTFLSEMMMACQLGKASGYLTEETYNGYVEEALLAAKANKRNIKKAEKWFEVNKDVLGSASTIVLYGSDSLYGVALEGALKILETAKKQFSVGYEIDDGLHGPTMGFVSDTVVVALSDGGKNEYLTQGIGSMMKEQFNGHGFIIGAKTQDDTDLKVKPVTENFVALEFAPFVQVLCYDLALYNGIPVLNTVERNQQKKNTKSYFNTHAATKN